jgi:hypothetical protein
MTIWNEPKGTSSENTENTATLFYPPLFFSRSTLASLEDFEARMNAAIERNAFLESELDEKESLKAAVQRMKDETRDLKSELKVMTASESAAIGAVSTPDNDKSLVMMKFERNNNLNNGKSSPDSNKHAAEAASGEKTASMLLETPPSSSKSSPSRNPPLTPSARMSALNIVGDLLRKVGALELKLSSCRNIVKENNGGPATPSTPLGAESRGRRSSRSGTPTTTKVAE